MATAEMIRQEVRQILGEEILSVIRLDPNVRYGLIGIMAETFAQRTDIQSILEHLDTLREDFNRQMAGFAQRQEEHSRQMEELARRLEELARRQEELRRDFNQQILRLTERHESLEQRMGRGFARLEATLGAIGARWGLMAEESFRSGMAGILRDQFGWQVERFLVMDTEGYVFGRPDQVEIDIAIHDGAHWLIEIRSSMSRPDMYTFVRKVELYERLRGVQVARRIVISPMIHPRARAVAERLNIELYTSVYDVSPDLSEEGKEFVVDFSDNL